MVDQDNRPSGLVLYVERQKAPDSPNFEGRPLTTHMFAPDGTIGDTIHFYRVDVDLVRPSFLVTTNLTTLDQREMDDQGQFGLRGIVRVDEPVLIWRGVLRHSFRGPDSVITVVTPDTTEGIDIVVPPGNIVCYDIGRRSYDNRIVRICLENMNPHRVE